MFDYSDIAQKKAAEIHAGIGQKPARKIKTPKVLAVVDQAQCTGCEACVQFCPVDCIEIVPGPQFVDMGHTVEIDLDRCIGCKLCAKYCPWDTIYMIDSGEAYDKANEWTLRSVVKLDKTEDQPLWAEKVEAPKVETPKAEG
jgi:electron transport complex protein RnfB